MLFLKSLRLKNFCHYKDHTFSFVKKAGTPYRYICFLGPNGSGKTTILEAIGMLSMNTAGRSGFAVMSSLRKYVRNTDYDPTYEQTRGFKYSDDFAIDYKDELSDMLIEGVYTMDGKEYVIQLTQNGYQRNDFAPVAPDDTDPEEVSQILNSGIWGEDHLLYRQRIAHSVTSDSDVSLSKFQLLAPQIEKMETLAQEITRYPTECVSPSGFTQYDRAYCTDIVFVKYNKEEDQDYRIHFKRMSMGERKVCKSFSQLLNLMYDLENPSPGEPQMKSWPRLLLLDNIVMHVYWDRHISMVECLKSQFSEQQIFATTHSGILIPRFKRGENDQENELMIDLEEINN